MPLKPRTSRSLTSGEIALARGVFGDAIDYSQVRVTAGKFLPFQPRGTAMAPEGNLYMYGCYSDDFSQMPLSQQGHFIHEMTHVWQFQNRILHPVAAAIELNLRHAFNYKASYDYKLSAGRDLLEYNMEQQASIVQDHFLRSRGCAPDYRGHCRTENIDAAVRFELLTSTLAKFQANPAYARRPHFPHQKPKR